MKKPSKEVKKLLREREQCNKQFKKQRDKIDKRHDNLSEKSRIINDQIIASHRESSALHQATNKKIAVIDSAIMQHLRADGTPMLTALEQLRVLIAPKPTPTPNENSQTNA